MASKGNNGADGQPIYPTFSCQLCNGIDTAEMVQCDFCDAWFHFACVGVSSDVADRDWNCQRCSLLKKTLNELHMIKAKYPCVSKEPEKPKSKLLSLQGSMYDVPSAFSFESARQSQRVSLTASQKMEALKRLDEEQESKEREIKLDILNRKFQVLHSSHSESEAGKFSSMENTLHWARKLQDIANDMSRVTIQDNVSISLSDHERHKINQRTSDELKREMFAEQSKRETFERSPQF